MNPSLIVEEFEQVTGCTPNLSAGDLDDLRAFCEGLAHCKPLPKQTRKANLIYQINRKLHLNADQIADFISVAATVRCFFNHRQRQIISRAFNSSSWQDIAAMLGDMKHELTLQGAFKPLSHSETVAAFRNELANTRNRRTNEIDSTITSEMVKSILGGFAFSCFAEKDVHQLFDPEAAQPYQESYWLRLHQHASGMFERSNTLCIADADDLIGRTYDEKREAAFYFLHDTFDALTNHGHAAVIIRPTLIEGKLRQWELAADITLYAEKHRSAVLNKGYFQWQKVQEATTQYIPELDAEAAQFNLVNEGYSYKDTFVLFTDENGETPPNLVVLFQKHERDETPIPCPACRSHLVSPNSYPSFGVRSWECTNWICPDRSMANRGKRFSFLSLLMQEASGTIENEIPPKRVREWSRDVRYGVSVREATDMLTEFYSLANDTITATVSVLPLLDVSRRSVLPIRLRQFDLDGTSNSTDFFEGPFFKRFMVEKLPTRQRPKFRNLGDEDHQIYCGDCQLVLQNAPENTFDGAVTSPPYYNAREYSSWPNIYTYLFDMKNMATEVFRTLKPGAFFLYNIFDYFDNENIVALSAMGQKRMILSAFAVYAFRTIGFEIEGNIVWDKGEIEGKRAFNGGNYSPYYQAPFNCWEHVLVFRKPGAFGQEFEPFPNVLKQKPVIKMRGGKNTHGHTAPFPDALPGLLVNRLRTRSIVLDPFGGSLTTGRVAEMSGRRGFSIELNEEYCQLGLSMRAQGSLAL